MLALEDEYKAISGKPSKPYKDTLVKFFWYRYNTYETSYYGWRDKKHEWLKKHGGDTGSGFWISKRSQALYNMKAAMKFENKKQVEKYYKEYKQLHYERGLSMGKTEKEIIKTIDQGIKQSIKNMHPLGLISEKRQEELVKSLDKEDREQLARALKY